MRVSPRSVMVFAALTTCAVQVGRADVIGFNSVLPWHIVPNGTGSHIESGYAFTPIAGNANGYIVAGSYQPTGNPQGNQALVNNGTPNLMCGNWVNLHFAPVGGQTFDFASLELGGTFDQEQVHRWGWASFVNIIGHRADGGPDLTLRHEVTSEFALEPISLHWSGLSSVDFVPERSSIGAGPNDYEFTIDNLSVSTVPAPSVFALFGVVAWKANRRRRSSLFAKAPSRA